MKETKQQKQMGSGLYCIGIITCLIAPIIFTGYASNALRDHFEIEWWGMVGITLMLFLIAGSLGLTLAQHIMKQLLLRK